MARATDKSKSIGFGRVALFGGPCTLLNGTIGESSSCHSHRGAFETGAAVSKRKERGEKGGRNIYFPVTSKGELSSIITSPGCQRRLFGCFDASAPTTPPAPLKNTARRIHNCCAFHIDARRPEWRFLWHRCSFSLPSSWHTHRRVFWRWVNHFFPPFRPGKTETSTSCTNSMLWTLDKCKAKGWTPNKLNSSTCTDLIRWQPFHGRQFWILNFPPDSRQREIWFRATYILPAVDVPVGKITPGKRDLRIGSDTWHERCRHLTDKTAIFSLKKEWG